MSIDAIKMAATSTDYTNSSTIQPVKPEIRMKDESKGIVHEVNRRTADVPNDVTSRETDKEDNGTTHGSSNTSEAVKKAINEINKSNPNSIVQFGVHEATNRMTIKILDKESRKVIKEFPAEKTLDLIAKAWEMAGIMVDEKR